VWFGGQAKQWRQLAHCHAPLNDATVSAGSYGSLARYLTVPRLQPFGESTIVGGSGDLSDFQKVTGLVDELVYVPLPAQT
jgi:hypothetical protein